MPGSGPRHRSGTHRGIPLPQLLTTPLRRALEFTIWLAVFATLAWAFVPGLGADLAGLEKRGWPAVEIPHRQDDLSDLPQTPLVLALRNLPIRARSPAAPPYQREQFGQPWQDVEGNGCDTRNDVLRRDLTQVTLAENSCQVESGILADPYSGKQIRFQRGKDTSTLIQIDHVVALADAWESGAWSWTQQKRTELANDPLELLAVSAWTNQEKSKQNLAQWQPPNRDFGCRYAAQQIAVKTKYRLSVTAAEYAALARTIRTCPGQELPAAKGF